MTRSRSIALALIAVSFSLAATGAANAQADDTLSQARTLFEAGLAAAREDRWLDARSAFERSLAVMERPSTLFNLAGAQVQTGQLREAVESYRRFLAVSPGTRDERLQAEAQAALAQAEGRVSHLSIELSNDRPGDQVRVDQAPVPPGALGDLVLNPGSHRIQLMRSDVEIAAEQVRLTEGERARVALVAPRPVSPPGIVAASIPTPPEETESRSNDDIWIGVGVGIGVAVVTAVAITIGVVVANDGQPQLFRGNLGDGMIRF